MDSRGKKQQQNRNQKLHILQILFAWRCIPDAENRNSWGLSGLGLISNDDCCSWKLSIRRQLGDERSLPTRSRVK